MVESLARIHPVRGCLGQGLNPAILITTVLSPSQGEPPTRCLLWVGQWGWGREGARWRSLQDAGGSRPLQGDENCTLETLPGVYHDR